MEGRSFCQFIDSENVKSIISLDPCQRSVSAGVLRVILCLIIMIILQKNRKFCMKFVDLIFSQGGSLIARSFDLARPGLAPPDVRV